MTASAVADMLSEQIDAGIYLPGHQLPSKSVLADELGVSTPTVQAAFNALTLEGVVTSRHGAGLFVRPPAEELPLSDLMSRFRDTETEVAEGVATPRWVQSLLDSEATAEVGIADGVLLTRWTRVGDTGATVGSATRLQSKAAGPDERRLLDLRPGTPVLAAYRICRTETGQISRVDRYTVVGADYVVDLGDLLL